jgi:hypothetical protein
MTYTSVTIVDLFLLCTAVTSRDGIGKGFVPEMKPMEDLLAKLKSRSKEVVSRQVS